jgi:hypothetical protein
MQGKEILSGYTFGVLFRQQTYLNLLYIVFTFPLGTAYFIFLLSGLLIGLNYSVVFFGILLFLFILIAWQDLAAFERELAVQLLGIQIEEPSEPGEKNNGDFRDKISRQFTGPVARESLAFLFIKFPLGIFSLIVLLVLGSASLILITTPFTYRLVPFNIMGTDINTLTGAVVATLAGIGMLIVTLHITNAMAKIEGYITKIILGGKTRPNQSKAAIRS